MSHSTQEVRYNQNLRNNILLMMNSKMFKEYIWEWQYHDDGGQSNFEPVILADKWGTVIGFNGYMPVEIKYNDNLIRGVWSCDFYVDERYRSQGVGTRIKHILNYRFPMILALGISDAALHVHKKAGWQAIQEVEAFKKISHINTIKSQVIWLYQLLSKMHHSRNRLIADTGLPDLQILIQTTLPDPGKLDALCYKVLPGYHKTIIRNSAYLRWKYQEHPLVQYKYLVMTSENALLALLVFRDTTNNLTIVDYLGPNQYAYKLNLFEYLSRTYPDKATSSCTTSDADWKDILLRSGYRRLKSKIRFNVGTSLGNKTDANSNWFIMGGDSDGDLLSSSEEGPFKLDLSYTSNLKGRYIIRRLDESAFVTMRSEWDALIINSPTDRLFLGWLWQYTWWITWSGKLGAELLLLGAFNDEGKLVGLAPLYVSSSKTFPFYKYKQIHFIGSSWGMTDTVRTEYIEYIVDKTDRLNITRAFNDYIFGELEWDQIIITDVIRNSLLAKSVDDKLTANQSLCRKVHTDRTILIDVSGSFDEYVLRLGKNTRYRAYNKRAYLESLGDFIFEYADADTIDQYFDEMNRLHLLRWGSNCFYGESLEFHKRLARAYFAEGQLLLSRIAISGKTVSVLYNIRVGNRLYNIQTGFDDKFDKKLSLGMIHLVIEIERAFLNEGIKYFDLLAGSGMNTFYKSHFGSESKLLVSYQIIKNPILRFIYESSDKLPLYVRKTFKRVMRL